MKKMYCPICGAEIMITRKVPDRSFTIEENFLESADHDPFGYPSDLIFHCMDDIEHNIEPQPDSKVTPSDFHEWQDEVEIIFNKTVLPTL